MAIKTGAIFNSLTFGGINSADYGIYITGEAVYNAPQRAVEMVAVPGRNGAIAIDQGRWENITVSYPAGTFEEDQSKFASAIAAYRNALTSLRGYQRLTDTYNPNEYRMGLFMDGIEVTPTQSRAGEFTISFNCKPQRWLVSGETSISADSGDSLINPTQYEASPLLEVTGYGNISVGDSEISIISRPIGPVRVSDGATTTQGTTVYFSNDVANSGDDLYGMDGDKYCTFKCSVVYDIRNGSEAVASVSIPSSSYWTDSVEIQNSGTRVAITMTCNHTYRYGVTDIVANRNVTATFTTVGGNTYDPTITIQTSYSSSTPGRLGINFHPQVSGTDFILNFQQVEQYPLYLNSSQSALGNPIYVDCEIGEAYKYENDTIVSVNGATIIPGNLPTLKPGSNSISFGNTVTDLKIVPRWWQL